MEMFLPVGLMAGLALAVQQVETPNYKEPEGGPVIAPKAVPQGSPRPNVLSGNDRSPSRIGMDAIPEVAVILGQFDSNVGVAKNVGAETYLNVGDGYLSVPGCRYYGQHPLGVARLSDGKFNGVAVLLQCSGHVMQVEISDFRSQPLLR